MKDGFYTFEDLIFHYRFPDSSFLSDVLQARLRFSNGYGVSVGYGEGYYSDIEDGIQTYELMGITPMGGFVHDDPLGYITEEEVTAEMIRLQKIGKGKSRVSEDDPYGEEIWED